MEVADQIKTWHEFFEAHLYDKLVENVRKGIPVIAVDFALLAQFSLELADDLLEHPDDALKAAELALARFDLGVELPAIRARLHNLPESQRTKIKDIRSKHLNKLIQIQGIVRQKTDVRPQVTSARFECPSCGNIINVLQLDSKFKEPTRCGCGRKGKFLLLSKELVDAQKLVLEEAPEDLEGGEQPKRLDIFLKNDLVSPLTERRTNPGSKVVVVGAIKEVPIPSREGGILTRYDLLLEANFVDSVFEEFSEISLSPGDLEAIRALSHDPRSYEKIVESMAPSIFGLDKIKEALLLQLMGGVKKVRDDGQQTRGDIHILLIGDPGCIAGDSQVALIYKGMEPIQNLGRYHLEPIHEAVVKLRKNEKDKPYDFAKVFHHYRQQPVLKVATETGKEIICTYNQPLLTKKGWERADELSLGTPIRVLPKIPSHVKNPAPTDFVEVEKKSGPLKRVNIPKTFTPELAALCGYVIGDGTIHPNGYRVCCYVNEEEHDLVEKLSALWEGTFGIRPRLVVTSPGTAEKTIQDGGGQLRVILSTQQITRLEIESKQVAYCLTMLSEKRVPQQIFRSPKDVMASFISWLFEADGCAFSTGRGRTSIQLKSMSKKLLQDVQLLLLYFGIQSRIIEDNLCIRRSRDIGLFAKHIGFNSEKKIASLSYVVNSLKDKSDRQKRKRPQRYERITLIEPAGIMDVYDFEVPKSHSFIANGIICHNSGKSQLLKRIAIIAPKSRFVSGKGASGAGLTAAVVRDEFLRGWALEAGALVLANRGLACIDELDKMSTEDRSAMHEALEQQTVTISKANIQATLRAETTVLAAANPKFGRFDPYEPPAKQLDLPATLLSRFDLIFPIRDLPDPGRDERLASFILKLHQSAETGGAPIETGMLKKYIAYAKQFVTPHISDEALEEIKEYIVRLRSQDFEEGQAIKTVSMSARQLEGLVRLAEASARTRLAPVVTRDDAKRAVELLHFCLSSIGMDPQSGKIDIDRITTGISATQRGNIAVVRQLLHQLEETAGKAIPLDDLLKEAASRGIPEADVEEALAKLKQKGDIFEPRSGYISRIQ